MEKLGNISRGEVTSETNLLIFDLSGGKLIGIVVEGLVKELLVENGLEEELEVAHETGVVTILVLGEDGNETEVLLVLDILAHSRGAETESKLDSCGNGEGVDHASKAHLKTTAV